MPLQTWHHNVEGTLGMALADELRAEVAQIFKDVWTERDGTTVPESEDIKLGNDGVWLDTVVLYADIADSTVMVDTYKASFCAEVYKAFLHCAAKIVRAEGGEITAYDGDRIMAVFIGDSKNTNAARAALKLNYARGQVINPALKAQYPKTNYEVRHVVAVDSSKLLVARTGIRGANDLVWVGRAANHAAKLAALSPDYPSRITAEVYERLNDSAKYGSDGRSMWEQVTWSDMGRSIYRSTWWWPC